MLRYAKYMSAPRRAECPRPAVLANAGGSRGLHAVPHFGWRRAARGYLPQSQTPQGAAGHR
jgi:hypothetical protein